MKKESIQAVVVLSGGQDSATCLALAVRRHGAGHVAAITFNYGQRHALETKYAKALARRFGIARHKVVRLDFYRHLTRNALLNDDIPIARRQGASCPTTVRFNSLSIRSSLALSPCTVWLYVLPALLMAASGCIAR